MRFPTVNGANLEGRNYQVPADLDGEYNVVILAFQRWHQMLVDSWMPQLAELAEAHPTVRYYELPSLENFGFFQRMMIDNGMRFGIPDRAVRARTITLYLNLRHFMGALAIPDTGTIHTLLLDPEGNVLWREAGECTPAKFAALEAAISQAVAGAAPQSQLVHA